MNLFLPCVFLFCLGGAIAQHWTPVVSSDFAKITEAIGIGFAPDARTGYCGVGINGEGSEIWKTTDGGVHWTSLQTGSNLFLAAAARDSTSAIITGVIDQMYTTNGTGFEASKNDFLSPSQDAAVMPGGNFAIAQEGAKSNGVATSKTGALWTKFDLGVNATLFPARYGAYPTDTTWYVSAGSFPTSNSIQGRHQLSETLHYDMNAGKKMFNFRTVGDAVNCDEDPTNCFSATIMKTIDGGKSFTTVFQDINNGSNIYPNGIHCHSEKQCVAAFEGDTCRIMVTLDGGATWKETMHDTDSACSLTYVHMMSESEVWVAGGHLSALDFEGRFWHSTDAGSTWQKEAVKGLYILDLDMVSATAGFALGLDASGSGAEILSYSASADTLVL